MLEFGRDASKIAAKAYPMIELKVYCDCGQKYKFDVEPVNGRMPFTVACPICKRDGTEKANELLQQMAIFKPVEPAPAVAAAPGGPPPIPAWARASSSAPPPISAAPSSLRISAPTGTDTHMVTAAAPAPLQAPRKPLPRSLPAQADKPVGNSNLGLGILGAFLGAVVGMGAMFGFFELAGFRFPLLGVGIGLLTGFGGRLLYKGTCSKLGFISGGIALVSVVGTLFLMYGEFPIISIISVAVSVSVAYRIAAS